MAKPYSYPYLRVRENEQRKEDARATFERQALTLLQSIVDDVNSENAARGIRRRLRVQTSPCHIEGGGETIQEPAYSIKERGLFRRRVTFLPLGDDCLEMFRGKTWDEANRNMLGPVPLRETRRRARKEFSKLSSDVV